MSKLKVSTDKELEALQELAACITCSGRGKVRANMHTDTSYTFNKETCGHAKARV